MTPAKLPRQWRPIFTLEGGKFTRLGVAIVEGGQLLGAFDVGGAPLQVANDQRAAGGTS